MQASSSSLSHLVDHHTYQQLAAQATQNMRTTSSASEISKLMLSVINYRTIAYQLSPLQENKNSLNEAISSFGSKFRKEADKEAFNKQVKKIVKQDQVLNIFQKKPELFQYISLNQQNPQVAAFLESHPEAQSQASFSLHHSASLPFCKFVGTIEASALESLAAQISSHRKEFVYVDKEDLTAEEVNTISKAILKNAGFKIGFSKQVLTQKIVAVLDKVQVPGVVQHASREYSGGTKMDIVGFKQFSIE